MVSHSAVNVHKTRPYVTEDTCGVNFELMYMDLCDPGGPNAHSFIIFGIKDAHDRLIAKQTRARVTDRDAEEVSTH